MITKENLNCKDCAECCKPVVVPTKEDIEKIKNAGHKDFLDLDPIHPENGKTVLKRINGYCMFLNQKTKLCTIYENRPDICKIYPFMEKDEVDDCVPRLF